MSDPICVQCSQTIRGFNSGEKCNTCAIYNNGKENNIKMDVGEIFDPQKQFPMAFGRISFMKMFAHGKTINIGAYEGKMFGDKVTNVDLYDFGAPNLTICNAEKLKFKDKEFDCAILSEILEHVDNPAKALQEAMRVAWSVAISVPNESEFSPEMQPFQKHDGPGYEPTSPGHHVRFYDQTSLYALFKETSFPLIYFAKINFGGWSALIAFGSTLPIIELCHRMAGSKTDPRHGQHVGQLTHCETIALIPVNSVLIPHGSTPRSFTCSTMIK